MSDIPRAGGAGLAMVTGASSGLGLAFAERLAVDGYDLLISARRRGRLEELAERLRRDQEVQVTVIEADLGSRFDITELAETAAGEPLSVLVNNAGLAYYMQFKDLPAESAEELVSVNVLAPTLLARAALPGMIQRRTGAIINVASMLAFSETTQETRLPGRAVYAATKAYVVAFSQLLQTELAGSGVRVQALCPGVVKTEFHTRQGMDASSWPRLDPDQVVTASMIALGTGELVCSPTVEDVSLIEQLGDAQRALLGASFRPEPAERYRQD